MRVPLHKCATFARRWWRMCRESLESTRYCRQLKKRILPFARTRPLDAPNLRHHFWNFRSLLWQRLQSHFRAITGQQHEWYRETVRLSKVFETYYALLSDRSLQHYVGTPRSFIPDGVAQHRIVSDFPRSGNVSLDLVDDIQRALTANVKMDSVLLSRQEVEALQGFVATLKNIKSRSLLAFRFSQLLELWEEVSTTDVYTAVHRFETRAAVIVAEVMSLEWDLITTRPQDAQHGDGTWLSQSVLASQQVRRKVKASMSSESAA
jgi:hypothetical protein